MNENTSTCVKCGYTLAQHDYVHGTRGNCGNFVDAGPFFDDRPLFDMNDITQLSTLYSNAIARAEKAEEARNDISQRILGTLDDFAGMQPEEGEDWESWYRAAFDLAREKIARLLSAPPPVRETP